MCRWGAFGRVRRRSSCGIVSPKKAIPSGCSPPRGWARDLVSGTRGAFPDRAAADRVAQRLATQERVSIMVTAEPGAMCGKAVGMRSSGSYC